MKQAESTHYNFLKYMHMARWSCYYTQIKNVLDVQPKNVLEIGPGDGLFGWYMEKNGIAYTSADHADDISSNVKVNLGYEKLPFTDNQFDMVCAFQVLEHIPFDKVPYALAELHRVSSKHVFLDIPESSVHIQFLLKLPLVPFIAKHITIPRPTKHEFDGFHHWEISKRGYSRKKVRQLMSKTFSVQKEFTIIQNPKERFYLLKKK